MDLEGKLLGNRYEIIEKIGSGGMATVYKAKCHVLNRYVAIKILKEEFTTDSEFIKKFNTEAQSAASLTHPNIVSVYDVGNEDDLHYIVMELIKGKTLKDIINDVEKNIYIVDGATYPDVEKGNFIIAAHSGPGWQAFFNDLYQLTIGDQIYVTYKGKKYTYQLTNVYKQEKTGKIAIYRNYEKSTLTLITCTNHDLTSQTVYISELINVY